MKSLRIRSHSRGLPSLLPFQTNIQLDYNRVLYSVMSFTPLSSRTLRKRGKRKLSPSSPFCSAYVLLCDICAQRTSITMRGRQYTSILRAFGNWTWTIHQSPPQIPHCVSSSLDTSSFLSCCARLFSCSTENPLPTQHTGRIFHSCFLSPLPYPLHALRTETSRRKRCGCLSRTWLR